MPTRFSLARSERAAVGTRARDSVDSGTLDESNCEL